MTAKTTYSVDDVLYILLTLGALYNNEALSKKNKRKVKHKMEAFIFQHIKLCKQAGDKVNKMNNEEIDKFLTTYQISENIKREVNII
jgi:hypothetical protein